MIASLDDVQRYGGGEPIENRTEFVGRSERVAFPLDD